MIRGIFPPCGLRPTARISGLVPFASHCCPCVVRCLVLSSLPLCCPYLSLSTVRAASVLLQGSAMCGISSDARGRGAGLLPGRSRQDTSQPLYLVERRFRSPASELPSVMPVTLLNWAQVRRARIVEFVGDLAEDSSLHTSSSLTRSTRCAIFFQRDACHLENNLLRYVIVVESSDSTDRFVRMPSSSTCQLDHQFVAQPFDQQR